MILRINWEPECHDLQKQNKFQYIELIILFLLVQLVIGGRSIIMIIVMVYWHMIPYLIIVSYVVLYLIWEVIIE